VVNRALRRARLIAIAEAAVWGVAGAPIAALSGLAIFVSVAVLRVARISRGSIIRALERAAPEARNLFVTADELGRGRLAAADAVKARVFADASSRASAVDLRRVCP